MEKKIMDLYDKDPSYKRVADELDMDWRAVKRVVLRSKAAASRTFDGAPAPVDSKYLGAAEPERGKQAPKSVTEHISADVDAKTDGHSSEQLASAGSRKEESENTIKAAIPPANEIFKVMYTAFGQGKRPDEVVALYALDPNFVQEHYQKFLEMRRCNPLALQSMILDVLDARSPSSSLQQYVVKFDKQGYLTNKDVIGLMRAALADHEKESVSRLLSKPEEAPPAGWLKWSCRICGEVLSLMSHYTDEGRRIATAMSKQDGLCFDCADRVLARTRSQGFTMRTGIY
ncbi:MAG TPA: hypothetical protein VF016_02005 [Nitrososphaera sp.]